MWFGYIVAAVTTDGNTFKLYKNNLSSPQKAYRHSQLIKYELASVKV